MSLNKGKVVTTYLFLSVNKKTNYYNLYIYSLYVYKYTNIYIYICVCVVSLESPFEQSGAVDKLSQERSGEMVGDSS